jgi:hypothetical protein
MGNVMELRPSPWKHLALLAISAGFVAGALLVEPANSPLKWFTVAFFGLGVVVALVTLVPGSSYLRLEPDRMSVRTLYRTWHVPWTDVTEFFVAPVGGRGMVCWNYTPESTRQKRGRAVSRAIAGVEAGLPDTYGRPAEELANLLNQWRSGVMGTRPNNSSKPTPLRGAA